MKRSKQIISFLLVLALLAACDPQMVHDQYCSIKDGGWSWVDGKEFTFEINDTLELNHVYLKVRHGVEYPYRNLYMFVHLKGPGDLYQKDTVNFILAEESGRWIGRGNAHLRELSLLYRKHVRFPAAGTYSITLEQAMRREELPVSELGVRIEKVKAE